MFKFSATVAELKEMIDSEDQDVIIVDSDKSIVELDSNQEQIVEVIAIAAIISYQGKPAIEFTIEDL